MLKRIAVVLDAVISLPAAFRRLCVETGRSLFVSRLAHQPPSGGCVLKRHVAGGGVKNTPQPPSGGCVLKHTRSGDKRRDDPQPPSGGCVLKRHGVNEDDQPSDQPPSGGCVLKLYLSPETGDIGPSRLQAAVC